MNDALDRIAIRAPSFVTAPFRDTRLEDAFYWFRFQVAEYDSVSIPVPNGAVDLTGPVKFPFYTRMQRGDEYEPNLVSELETSLDESDVVYDIVSRFGFFSKYSALVGVQPENIHSFEVNRYRYYLLQENLDDGEQIVHSRVDSSTERRPVSIDSYTDRHKSPTVV
ncbi:hypothetical protein [Halobacterium sp. CBA1126]|uniref:hypothetical protein n=1 Tax=Halobacterium sp. CBA1126 TaxID=2668074 RepID=UPI0012FCE903|nr:hypothetical protein [Halobacterium sp. CBA1126]MUV59517.1 hypothetical protein [Halobacterium sp. CBA1126]